MKPKPPPLPPPARLVPMIRACAASAYEAVRQVRMAQDSPACPPLPWDLLAILEKDLAFTMARHVLCDREIDLNGERYDFLQRRGWAFSTLYDPERRLSPMMRHGDVDATTAARDALFLAVTLATSRALGRP